jgi:hypothetical protein
MPERKSFSPNPEWMFQTSEAFWFFALFGPKSENQARHLEVPLSMNLAFATEGYLKCLRVLEMGECKSGHKLKDLFNDLGPKTRSVIEDRHRKAVETGAPIFTQMRKAGLATDLRSLLEVGGDAFERFRYVYEKRLTKAIWCLDAFTVIVRDLILEKEPDLAKYQLVSILPDYLSRGQGDERGF